MKYLILIPLMAALLLAGTHEFDYSELHPYLYDITQLDPNDSYFIVGDGTDWIRETGATARTSLGLGTGDSPAFTGLTIDTDTLVVDDVNDRVGIGTSSPDSVFHIKANIAGSVGSHSAGQIIIQNPADSVFSNVVITGYESDGSGNPDQQLWYLGSSSVGNTDIIFLNRRNAKLALGTNGISHLTILGNGNILIYNDANIGGELVVIDDANIYGALTVTGTIDILHTATEADDHTLELDVDAAGFGDVKAIDIDYVTGAISAGEDEGIILINIDEILATGGDVFGLEVLATEGSAGIYGMKVGAVIGPIHQDSGTFANPTTGTDNTADTNEPNMIDGDFNTITAIFESNSEYIIIGAAAAFEEIEFILTTGSSGAGIKPTYGYSTAGPNQFTTFTPVDGTNGFRNTGVIAWDAGDLTSHGINTDTGTYDIKITRTRVALGTSPVLGYAKTAATTEYIWDANGDINIKDLTASGIITDGTFSVTGGSVTGLTIGGAWTAAGQTCADLGTVTTANIDGGAIDAVTIGTNSACTELQVDLLNFNGGTISYDSGEASSSILFADLQINLGSDDLYTIGTVIGGDGVFGHTAAIGSGVIDVIAGGSGDPHTIVYVDNYCNNIARNSALYFRKSLSDTIGTKTETTDGTDLGSIFFQGIDTGGNFDWGGRIFCEQYGDAGVRVPVRLLFQTSTSTTQIITGLDICPAGEVFMPQVYNDDVGAISGIDRDLLIDPNGQLGYDSSSARYKENIRDLTGSERIYDLRPRLYNRIGLERDEAGLIAEEVELTMPEVVSYKTERIRTYLPTYNENDPTTADHFTEKVITTNQPETVVKSQLIVPMIKEIQNLKAEIDALKARVTELEKK